LKKPIKRRPSEAAIKLQQSTRRLDQKLQAWDALSPFERRVMRYKMGLPRALYKYRPIPLEGDHVRRKQFEDLVLDNQLWLSTVSSFNDPFEGHAAYDVPYTGTELRRQLERKYRELGYSSTAAKSMVRSDDVAHPERLSARAQQALERTLGKIGINSLAATPFSPLLWAHYADSHKGLSVQLRPHVDLKVLRPHRVEYSDEYPILTDILKPAAQRDVLPMLRKSSDWKYEEEWRLVSEGRANFYQRFAPEAMGAVIFGIRISDVDRAYVLGLMDERERRYGMRPAVYQAKLHPRRYRIMVSRLR
jgi:Protein of unknown function (DUF2971)